MSAFLPAVLGSETCDREPWTLLFVVSNLGVGGSETKIVKIANALVGSGAKAEIAYLSEPHTLRDRIDPAVPVTSLQRRGKFSLGACARLARHVSRGRYLVASVNLYPLLYVIPAVKVAGSAGARAACLINMADIVARRQYHAALYKTLLRRCDRLVFGYSAQADEWCQTLGLCRERVLHIYNGVSKDYLLSAGTSADTRRIRRNLGIPVDAPVIGSIGRLVPEKNYGLLIRAFAELQNRTPRPYLVLGGEGAERQALEQLASEHGVRHRTIFLGLVDDPRDVLPLMDIFVLPSRSEAFSNAALEAMAMRRTVVLSDTGGAREMVVDGLHGLIFQSEDRQELALALGRLLGSAELRDRLGAAAHQQVVRRFSFDEMLDHYRRLTVEVD